MIPTTLRPNNKFKFMMKNLFLSLFLFHNYFYFYFVFLYVLLYLWLDFEMYIITPRQKIRFKIRKIDRSYLFLQRFDKFWISSTCNDRKGKLCEFVLKFGRKNLWKHFKSWVRGPWVCPWHIFRDYWRSCSIPFPERCRPCNLQTSASYRQCTGVCCNNSWIWVVPSWFSKR